METNGGSTQLIKGRLRLIGVLVTPIIVNKYRFYVKGCKITISKDSKERESGYFPAPIRRTYTRLTKGERKVPVARRGYKGYIIVDFPGLDAQAAKRLQWFLEQDALGAFQNDGMGKVMWRVVKTVTPVKKAQPFRKFRIREGLGGYPEPVMKAITALLLHDLVHTDKHLSKIYQEVKIEDEEIWRACKNHHSSDVNDNWLILIIKKYDHIAAIITRRHLDQQLERNERYDKENGVIDFKQLAEEIEDRQNNPHQLYKYIKDSFEFERITESIQFSKDNLKRHLLLSVNLFLNDYQKGKIIIEKNKLKLISLSEKKLDGSTSSYDAEMHLPNPEGQNFKSEDSSQKRKEDELNWDI
jgi:hypothetical protein